MKTNKPSVALTNLSSKFTPHLILFVISLVMLSVTSLHAQIGSLGIYGSAPAGIQPNVFYARLDPDVPPWAQCEGCEQYLPLNGHKNFNFWYTPDGSGFLSPGNYKVSYWNESLTTQYGGYDYVYYPPDSTHTSGVQVRPFSSYVPEAPPRGIYGNITGFNRLGQVVALPNLTVTAALQANPNYTASVRTNGAGFFSIYYRQESLQGFLQPADFPAYYDVLITGTLGRCRYSRLIESVDYNPTNASIPTLPSYYYDFASAAVNISPLPCL